MSAGALREQIKFQSPTSVPDGYGGTTLGWTDQFTVWARVRPLKGGESVLAERLTGTQPVIITVRQSSNTMQIQPEWRAVDANDETRIFQVKAPPANMDEKNAYLDILAASGVAG